MYLSELISRLEVLRMMHGDCEAKVNYYDIESVDYDSDINSVNIEG